MKKQEIVYREVACGYLEGRRKFTQLDLAKSLGVSLSTVNSAISGLEEINAVKVGRRSFSVIEMERLLLYWATKRKLSNDIVYQTRVDEPAREIEASQPDDIAFTCYTAYRLLFREAPADYSEVYVYAGRDSLEEIKRRFERRGGPPNLIVLKADPLLEYMIEGKRLKHSAVCGAQLFVDLWNLKAWYAKDFTDALSKRLGI